MKRVKAQPITKLLQAFMRQEGLETPLLQYRITHQGWTEVAGQTIAYHTEDLSIYNQTLYIQCNNAAVKQEIMSQRTDLIQRLNKFVDAYIINNIIVK